MPLFRGQLRIVLPAMILLSGSLNVEAAPDDVEPPPPPNLANNRFFMNDDNFDANVFQPGGNPKQARLQIEAKLKLQLDELNRVCGLDEAQMQKLKLAASSDVKRFFDDVDTVRKKIQSQKQDQNAWGRMWQEIQPLQMRLSVGLFGDTSFFSKTIRKTLTEEQYAKYNAAAAERRRYRYKASIETVITSFEDAVALNQTQHEAIVKLLLEETQPPLTFGQHDQTFVMFRMSRLPESKLRAVLSERQWKQTQIHFIAYREMGQFLVTNGLLPKEEVEVKVVKARAKRQSPRPNTPADASQPENRTRAQPAP